MSHLREDIETHRWSVLAFLLLWALMCVLTAAVVMRYDGPRRDERVIAISLMAPLAAGITAWNWRTPCSAIGAVIGGLHRTFSIGCLWYVTRHHEGLASAVSLPDGGFITDVLAPVTLHAVLGVTLAYLGATMARATRRTWSSRGGG